MFPYCPRACSKLEKLGTGTPAPSFLGSSIQIQKTNLSQKPLGEEVAPILTQEKSRRLNSGLGFWVAVVEEQHANPQPWYGWAVAAG